MGTDHLHTPEVVARREANRRSSTEKMEADAANTTPIRYKPGYEGSLTNTEGGGVVKFTQGKKAVFLFMLSETGRVATAAHAVGVSPSTVRAHRHKSGDRYDPEFAELYDEAMELYADSVEAEVERRAMFGVKEPVFGGKDKDRIVGYVRKYSDRLLELHVKRHRPEYRDKITVNRDDKEDTVAPVADALANLTREQRAKLRAFIDSTEPVVLDAEVVEDAPVGELEGPGVDLDNLDI